MLGYSVQLLNNASAVGASFVWPGGRGCFAVVGTLGGATVSLQALGPDSATWVDVGTTTSLTAAGIAAFDLPAGSIRANVTSGTPSALYANAARVPQ